MTMTSGQGQGKGKRTDKGARNDTSRGFGAAKGKGRGRTSGRSSRATIGLKIIALSGNELAKVDADLDSSVMDLKRKLQLLNLGSPLKQDLVHNAESLVDSRKLSSYRLEPGASLVLVRSQKRYFISSSFDQSCRVWDLDSGFAVKVIEDRTIVTSAAINVEEMRVVLGYQNGFIALHDLLCDGTAWKKLCHSKAVSYVDVEWAGDRFISGSQDCSAVLWDLKRKAKLQTFLCSSAITAAVTQWRFGRLFTTAHDGTLCLWDMASASSLWRLHSNNGAFTALDVDSENTRMVTANDAGQVHLWRLNCRKVIRSFPAPAQGQVFGLSVDWCGDRLAYAFQRQVLLWNLSEGALLLSLEEHTAPVRTLIADWEIGFIVSGSEDRSLKVWDALNGDCFKTYEGHRDGIQCVAFA